MKTRIIITAALVLLALSASASATTWWDLDWERRANTIGEITGVPSGGGTYRVNLHYGEGTNSAANIYCNYHAKDYFDDVRFVMDDGTVCDYWIDWNAYPPAVASVVVPHNGRVYCYYDNPSAPAGVTTIHDGYLIEDFESTSGWEIYADVEDVYVTSTYHTQGSNCMCLRSLLWEDSMADKSFSIPNNFHYSLIDIHLVRTGTVGGCCEAKIIYRPTSSYRIWEVSDWSGVNQAWTNCYSQRIPSTVRAYVCGGGGGSCVHPTTGDTKLYVDNLRVYCYQQPYKGTLPIISEEAHYAYPYITSYLPSPIPVLYENDSQTFRINLEWMGVTNCTTYWYLDGSLEHTNTSLTSTHRSYTNSSLKQGYYNLTVVANTSQHNNSMTWLFPVYPPTAYIDSYSPLVAPVKYVNQSQAFSVNITWTSTEHCQTTWYINNSPIYVNPSTTSTERAYTNTSLQPGLYNFSVVAMPGGDNPVPAMMTWWVYVYPATYIPDAYPTISAAVTALCGLGISDVILVRDGTYTENIALPTGCDNISIVSENGSATTIIAAASGSSPVIDFSSNENILIQGFTIKDGSYGITVDSPSSNIQLHDNLLTTNFNAGLYITGSHANLSTTGTTCSYNQDGIILYSATQTTIDNATCTYNSDDGINIQASDHITIDNCTCTYNANNGIELVSSSDFNIILNNTIEYNNDYGAYIATGSDYNRIYNNKFNNGVNGYDEALNTWYTAQTEAINIIGGQYTGGNYYSDYAGDDSDNDGIGDTPYSISGGSNKDMLPLIGAGMWVAFDAPTHLIGETATVSYHLTDPTFSTYNYFIEVRDPNSALVATWQVPHGESSGTNDLELKLGWTTGTYTVFLWRTPKAGGGEVLLDQDTMGVSVLMKVMGTVYDVRNNAILSGVTVTYTQGSTPHTDTSGADGTYVIYGMAVDSLTTTTATKAGYTHDDYTFTLLAEQAYGIDIYLLPTEPYRSGNTIGGCVLAYPFNQAIAGATVTIGNDTWSTTTTTNPLGFYMFQNLVTGYYSVNAAKSGYFSHSPDNVSV